MVKLVMSQGPSESDSHRTWNILHEVLSSLPFPPLLIQENAGKEVQGALNVITCHKWSSTSPRPGKCPMEGADEGSHSAAGLRKPRRAVCPQAGGCCVSLWLSFPKGKGP